MVDCNQYKCANSLSNGHEVIGYDSLNETVYLCAVESYVDEKGTEKTAQRLEMILEQQKEFADKAFSKSLKRQYMYWCQFFVFENEPEFRQKMINLQKTPFNFIVNEDYRTKLSELKSYCPNGLYQHRSALFSPVFDPVMRMLKITSA